MYFNTYKCLKKPVFSGNDPQQVTDTDTVRTEADTTYTGRPQLHKIVACVHTMDSKCNKLS